MTLQDFIDSFVEKGDVAVYLDHKSNYQGFIRKSDSGIKLNFSLGNYSELKTCEVTSVFAELEEDFPIIALIVKEQ